MVIQLDKNDKYEQHRIVEQKRMVDLILGSGKGFLDGTAEWDFRGAPQSMLPVGGWLSWRWKCGGCKLQRARPASSHQFVMS